MDEHFDVELKLAFEKSERVEERRTESESGANKRIIYLNCFSFRFVMFWFASAVQDSNRPIRKVMDLKHNLRLIGCCIHSMGV